MDVDQIELDKDCPDPEESTIGEDFQKIVTPPENYSKFFKQYLIKNRPCIIGDFLTLDWKSRVHWVSEKRPNWQHLQDSYGDVEVPVADCCKREYNAQKKTTYKLSEYVTYIKRHIEEGYPVTNPTLYLKDWHFTRDFPFDNVYRVPKYFASDWLNEYYSTRTDVNDDYRFVYIGPKGTWTPLHADVFTSFSWSVNVVGRKRWLLFPPGQEIYLKDCFGNLAYDATCPEVVEGDTFPQHSCLQYQYDIVQEAGEAIFVPSGWHHQVWNLEDTISINHNWINGCNIRHMWSSLRSSLTAVQKEVADCRDMDDWELHCQLMLRATHGLDLKEFYDMLVCVAKPRIALLKGIMPMVLYGGWQLGHKHAAWDLRQVLAVLQQLMNDSDTQCLPWFKEAELENLNQQILEALNQINCD